MEHTTAIELRHITKRFGKVVANDDISLEIRRGEILSLLGENGSGKTTLMSWILSTIPNEKRIFTIENGCREFDLVKEDAEGNVLNNVVHTVTRFSDDPCLLYTSPSPRDA